MKAETGGFLGLVTGKKGLLAAALGLGVLLLLLPRIGTKSQEAPGATEPPFSLEAEESRIARALSKVAGAGQVTVILTLETGPQREYARNTEDSRQSGGGESRTAAKSEVARSQDEALTIQYGYPKYRGALVIVQGDGSTLKLEITQAVSALTGLGSDRITVIRGG